jgi:hypothetical protein
MQEKFATYSEDKLIEIVRNYKVYGYSEQIRSMALEELKSRGIDEEVLRLQGKINNQQYDNAEHFLARYGQYSKIALVAYLITLSLMAFTVYAGSVLGLFLFPVAWLVYVGCLFASFNAQSKFYRAVKKERKTTDFYLFFFLGMPLYVFVYLHFREKMKEDMSLVN